MVTKIIYCPECSRKLGSCDSKTTIPKIIDCKECKKRVIYYPANKKTEINPIPKRNISSGKTFY